jgi:hypothetical protein
MSVGACTWSGSVPRSIAGGRLLTQLSSGAGALSALAPECTIRWRQCRQRRKARRSLPLRHVHRHYFIARMGMRERPSLDCGASVAQQRGGQCLSVEYRNGATPLEWRCARGHTWRAASNRVLQGNWCRQCYYDSMRDTLESMQEMAKSRGGRCLSERYVDAATHLVWECDKGHAWRAVPHSIANGTWCPQCAILRRCESDRARSRYLPVRTSGGCTA